jgi:peptidoglycan/xylan/chitin deacetylase (PgdA/CDA1 family)
VPEPGFGVTLSFDLDAEPGLACRALPGGTEERLSLRSDARFALTRGLPRVLARLERYAISATFYVPGVLARTAPDSVRAIAAAGHELAHHGYEHLPSHALDDAAQRHEIEAGLAALEQLTGRRPVGYRSPAWELTPVTLALLAERGFAYDSSLMGDDRPYRLDDGLVELPVHWSLDDVPYFAYGPGIPHAPLADARAVARAWVAEHDLARADDRHLTYTMHPEVIGRGHRIGVLDRLLAHLAAESTHVTTHRMIAAQMGALA